MKTKALLVAAIYGSTMSLGSAFTLDAVGYDGTGLAANPYSIFVTGYGEVVFETPKGSALVLNSGYQNQMVSTAPAVSFEPKQAVKIAYKQRDPGRSDGARIDLRAAAIPEADKTTSVRFAGPSGEGAGIPEPASMILGLLGSIVLLVLRRR